MALLTLRDIRVLFDEPPLLDGVGLSIERGERICLLGRNGAGKSTLLKIIAGEVTPDSGDVARERGITVSYLPQEVPQGLCGAVFDVVAGGLKEAGDLIALHHALSSKIAGQAEKATLERLSEIQHELEESGGWLMGREVERAIAGMRLDPAAP
ncbi:MAG TPA: ATP-binding cassette domain-containing protein, partial [bacterium]|nr:ATP-binding cassette domain-containing protein [bacterium]